MLEKLRKLCAASASGFTPRIFQAVQFVSVLERQFSLKETLSRLRHVELTPESRFWFGSPCRCVRYLDVLIHIILPEMIENRMPRFCRYLRRTSPRWGRSWRKW